MQFYFSGQKFPVSTEMFHNLFQFHMNVCKILQHNTTKFFFLNDKKLFTEIQKFINVFSVTLAKQLHCDPRNGTDECSSYFCWSVIKQK